MPDGITPDEMAASSAESTELRLILVLVILWGITGIAAAAALDATRSMWRGSWNPSAGNVHLAVILVAGMVLPIGLTKVFNVPVKGPGLWRFGPLTAMAAWFAAWIAGIGLENMFWLGSTYDPRREVFALHITFGAALLFLGAYFGRREIPMAVVGGLLLLSSVGQWFVTEILSAPFFVACVGLSHVALACYYAGILVRKNPPELSFSSNVQRLSQVPGSGTGQPIAPDDSSRVSR